MLRKHSTIKIGGEVERLLRLPELFEIDESLPLPIRVLGNGSNVLIDDRGLRGTVLLTRGSWVEEVQILDQDSQSARLRAPAGLYLPRLARWCATQTLSGCEFMVGVPGTVGGAVVQNAGANGQELKDILKAVEVFDLHRQKPFMLNAEQCELSYRSSALKDSSYLVLAAILDLPKSSSHNIEKQMELNTNYRREKTPFSKPTLGSTFTRLWQKGAWIYPGKLIEEAGLKGAREGGAMVSPVHANYIVNENNASFEDALKLIHRIEETVFEHSGIELRREIDIWSDPETDG